MARDKNPALFVLITGALIVAFYGVFSSHRSTPLEKTTSETPVAVKPAVLLPSAPRQDFATPPSPRPVEQVQVAPPPATPPPKPRPLIVKGVYNPPPLEGPHAAELTRIEDLAVTYDAREVPALAAFLTHDSAEVRAAAIDGLIRLGSKEAAEPLRAASAKVKDPREAIAMLDAADYLELPPMPASMRNKVKAAKPKDKASAVHPNSSSTPAAGDKTTAVNGG